VKPRAQRRFRKAVTWLRRIVGLGGLVAKRDDVKEGLRVGAEVLEVLDPNEKQLRDEYGVPPDRGGR
jgi:hypothetical protein